MMRHLLLDTGPLVALLDRGDTYHQWAKDQVAHVETPLRTCEAVLTEACFLFRHWKPGSEAVLGMLAEGHIRAGFRLEEEAHSVAELMGKYANLPISLADACLVRMAEQDPDSSVLTLDSDFRIYRKNGRQVIPTIMPPR